ncbi:unnamed protein product [Allacma fusca]|uniref:ABC transporter TMD0 domain-containing protein n=1 Tax=Allacma fusca TaxID=39272 RepID=A0A8J2PMG5_9HEXA|nr:unnamed protein product [Allacma fusca]
MDDFCGSTFWDLNRTWNTDDPDFTPCFEDTVLVWVPSLEACNLGNAIVMQSDGYNVFPVAFWTPIIKIVTYILALYLLHFSRTRGIQSAGVQFLFWLLLTVCETITFRSVIRQRDVETPGGSLPFVINLIYYPLIVGQLLINCWADLRPEYEQNPRILKDRPCPEKDSSYLNRILFSWHDGLAWSGWRRPLEHKDLWALNAEDTSQAIVPKFDACFKRSLEKTKKKGNPNKNEKQITSILPALFGAFGGTFFFGAALKIFPDLMGFVQPQILNSLIDFINTGGDVWKGYFLAAIMFLCLRPMLQKESQQQGK